jgi:cytochrome d ubiquinol oxidase subunit I
MDSALTVQRLTFAFTSMFHYLFPQLTMGLALYIVVLKTLEKRRSDPHYGRAARFWARIFGLNFVMGVVTGIPLEFQFGTSWAAFSKFSGAVIGQTLAMEGVFSFFLESVCLGLFLYGEGKVPRWLHTGSAWMLCLGTWLSGFFIVATNAWMQHPVGWAVDAAGKLQLDSLAALLTNPWLLWQFLHTMAGSVVTASFVMASVGAFYLLAGRAERFGRTVLRLAVPGGLVAALAMAFPTGDGQGKNVARYQPVALAAMEGLFESKEGAALALVGQPDMERLRLDNPIEVPRLLSFLTYSRWKAEVKGLDAFPRETWPQNVPLLYYGYHIMVGLGTIFIGVLGLATLLLRKDRLFSVRPALWLLMLSLPFPYIANTTGWMTAELGRQPWLVYGILRTANGVSPNVSAGNGLFVLLGFLGMYAALGILALFLVSREIERGPEPSVEDGGAG